MIERQLREQIKRREREGETERREGEAMEKKEENMQVDGNE